MIVATILMLLMAVVAIEFVSRSGLSGSASVDHQNRSEARMRLARVLVRIAGLIQAGRRDELQGELSAIQLEDDGLDFAVGALTGVSFERLEVLRRPFMLRQVAGSLGGVAVPNLAVHPGTVTGLIGSNGYGRSTLVRSRSVETALGDGRLALGDVIVRGGPIDRITVLRPDVDLIPTFTVAENIALARRSGWLLPRCRERTVAQAALDAIGWTISLEKVASDLTPFERFQVCVAREVAAGRSGLLVVDEPGGLLSTELTTAFSNTIANLGDLGFGVIVVSPQLELVRIVADRVAVLHDGRLVRDAPFDEITNDEIISCITGEARAA